MTDTPAGWRFEHTYAALPEVFHAAARPAPAKAPKLAVLNRPLAAELGLSADALTPELLAGQSLPPGGRFLAQAYAGHQFGGFTVLGDGRATLLGEHRTPDGRLVDVQFKGSGPTRFSRGGDGRAALGPMLREYVVSEAMHALGVPTTRSLAVVTTGEPVFRETVKRGAVLTRVAASHLRVGTFEYAAALGDEPAVRALADYAVARHDPDLADSPDKHLRFFRAVLGRQAALVARWQLVGFVHGVMNTDNMAVSGETIDYGPCAFLDRYDPGTVFSSIDRAGRYAYGNQPAVAQWNLARFAESLLPLFAPDQEESIRLATAALDEFPDLFSGHWLAGMRRKLGLRTTADGDQELADDLLTAMAAARADWTNTFAGLSPAAPPADPGMAAWHARWVERLGRAGESPEATDVLLRAANPRVIPRNHRVEEALAAAEDRDDFAPLHALLAAVTHPFEPTAGYTDPPADDCGYRTFCGT